MNTPCTLKRGDVVYFDYGCMHGSDHGTVVDAETTEWGTHYWVRKSDFTMTTVSTVSGTVTAKVYTDANGEEFLSARGVKGIGSYLVTEMTPYVSEG